MSEIDTRMEMIDALTSITHGNLTGSIASHQKGRDSDGFFYPRLATWIVRNSVVRDLKIVSIVTLLSSKNNFHRAVGSALLHEIQPYQIADVIRWIHGHHVSVPVSGSGRKIVYAKRPMGLFDKNPTRYLVSQARHYMADLESNHGRFDRALLNDRDALETIYRTLRIKPGKYAEDSLFGEPPYGSAAWAVKTIMDKGTPTDTKLDLIADYNVPDKVASSAAIVVTPELLAIMIQNMTPNGIQQRVKWFESKGAYDVPELKKAILDKLAQVERSARTDTGTMQKQTSVADKEVSEQISKVQTARIRRETSKLGNMLFAIDFSYSMGALADQGITLAWQMSQAGENLDVVVFHSATIPLRNIPRSLNEAMTTLGLSFGGTTSYGAPIRWALQNNKKFDRIVFVGDGGENEPPLFINEMAKYKEAFGAPIVTFLKGGMYDPRIERAMDKLEIEYQTYAWNDKAENFSAIMSLLSRPTKYDLYQEIIDITLPTPK